MEKDRENVLWQNEISANKLQARALVTAAGIFMIVCLLFDTDFFYIYRWNRVLIRIILLSVEALLVSGAILAYKNHYEKRWLKYVMMFILLLAFAVMDMIFTYSTAILMVIPIILSSRYFSRKFTLKISLIVVGVFFISSILGALFGNYDINNLELTPGTVIDMGENGWIADVIEEGGLVFDNVLMVKNNLFYSFFPKLLQTAIAATVCITIAHHGKAMVEKQKDLTDETARLETELSLAAKIQTDALPNTFPAFPERKEFEIYASMNPAKEVGGDFYDFLMIDDDHLYMVIADVSGKGVPAALFMMASKILLSEHAMMGKSPAQILTDVNNAILENNENDMFVSVWAAILELSTGKLTAANAGHECPVVKTPEGNFELYKDKHGFVVGGLPDVDYKEYEIDLKPGSKIFVYTDGIPEATDKDHRQYGPERMVNALNSVKDDTPENILKGIHKSVDEFVLEAEQFDDLTMMCLEYFGP